MAGSWFVAARRAAGDSFHGSASGTLTGPEHGWGPGRTPDGAGPRRDGACASRDEACASRDGAGPLRIAGYRLSRSDAGATSVKTQRKPWLAAFRSVDQAILIGSADFSAARLPAARLARRPAFPAPGSSAARLSRRLARPGRRQAVAGANR